jgi:hypothetical protein
LRMHYVEGSTKTVVDFAVTDFESTRG